VEDSEADRAAERHLGNIEQQLDRWLVPPDDERHGHADKEREHEFDGLQAEETRDERNLAERERVSLSPELEVDDEASAAKKPAAMSHHGTSRAGWPVVMTVMVRATTAAASPARHAVNSHTRNAPGFMRATLSSRLGRDNGCSGACVTEPAVWRPVCSGR